jgi:endonuclease-3
LFKFTENDQERACKNCNDGVRKIYPEVPIPLNHKNAYELLVAVALSAQTTDKKVNEVTPKLFSVAPNPEKMAALEEPEIKELIKEIGLSTTKAKNLKLMANQLLKDITAKFLLILKI